MVDMARRRLGGWGVEVNEENERSSLHSPSPLPPLLMLLLRGPHGRTQQLLIAALLILFFLYVGTYYSSSHVEGPATRDNRAPSSPSPPPPGPGPALGFLLPL